MATCSAIAAAANSNAVANAAISATEQLEEKKRQANSKVCHFSTLKRDRPLHLQVMQLLESRGVTLRVASEKLIAEEAPESYKDVSQVGQAAATVETETIASLKLGYAPSHVCEFAMPDRTQPFALAYALWFHHCSLKFWTDRQHPQLLPCRC